MPLHASVPERIPGRDGGQRDARHVATRLPRMRARSQRTTKSRPTKRITRPWISSVRFDASSGWKIDGVEVPGRRPGEECAEEQCREEGSHRCVAAEQRDRDARERDADAGDACDVACREPELPAEDVDRARDPRERARDRHREEVVAGDADPAVPRCLRVEADRLDAVPERRAVQDRPVDDERAERDEEADVEALQQRVAPEDVELGPLDDVVRDREPTTACRSGAARRARTGTARPRSRSS